MIISKNIWFISWILECNSQIYGNLSLWFMHMYLFLKRRAFSKETKNTLLLMYFYIFKDAQLLLVCLMHSNFCGILNFSQKGAKYTHTLIFNMYYVSLHWIIFIALLSVNSFRNEKNISAMRYLVKKNAYQKISG